MIRLKINPSFWWLVIAVLVIIISIFHYTTPTMNWQYHLIFMEAYFIPILIAAFQFGLRGGLGIAIAVSIIYFPHVMLQWGGLIESNLMRFLQLGLFNIIGYLTGLKSEAELREKQKYQKVAEELRYSFDQLEQQSEQLSELEEQLRFSERLAVVGELTASLAHEVRNPLGSIRGATEILQEELPETGRSNEFFQILIQETKRLNQVLENFLNFSRKHNKEEIQYSFNEVIRSVVQMLAPNAKKSKIKFEISLPDTPVTLCGDPNHLRQIMMNLLINSIHVLDSGGEIQISADILTKQKKKAGGEKFIELEIRDQGPGIPAENLERIFKPFYTTKPQGTGLGLAIVRRLVDENNWKIEVRSKPGQGTTFKLFIPVNNHPV